jgi:hypothetical protein
LSAISNIGFLRDDDPRVDELDRLLGVLGLARVRIEQRVGVRSERVVHLVATAEVGIRIRAALHDLARVRDVVELAQLAPSSLGQRALPGLFARRDLCFHEAEHGAIVQDARVDEAVGGRATWITPGYARARARRARFHHASEMKLGVVAAAKQRGQT